MADFMVKHLGGLEFKGLHIELIRAKLCFYAGDRLRLLEDQVFKDRFILRRSLYGLIPRGLSRL